MREAGGHPWRPRGSAAGAAGLTRTDGWASRRAPRSRRRAPPAAELAPSAFGHHHRMADEPIDVDRLRRAAPVEVMLMDGFRVGEGPIRAPHRHGYHELILVRDGARRAGDRRRRGAGAARHGDRDRPGPGASVPLGRGPARRRRALHRRARSQRRRPDPRGLAAERPRRPHDRAAAGRARAARTRSSALLAGEAARPPDPYAAGVQQHLLGDAAALARALVRRVARRAPRRPTTPTSSCTAASRSALEADFAAPPRRRPLRRRARASRPRRSPRRCTRAHRPHDEGAHHSTA